MTGGTTPLTKREIELINAVSETISRNDLDSLNDHQREALEKLAEKYSDEPAGHIIKAILRADRRYD